MYIKNNNRSEQERKDASKESREVVKKINLLEEEILILDRKSKDVYFSVIHM